MGRLDFILSFFIFVLTCLMMAKVQVETCSTYVKVTILIKINLCCDRLNDYSLTVFTV